MANKTIYGCVNWTTGQAVFVGEACNEGDYTGCVEWTGEHAGQVKVVVLEANCDDTYYGCVNWTTGKFQLVIPDDCCEEPPPECSCEQADECPECYATDNTPRYILIEFSGVIDCNTGLASDLNGFWCLENVGGCEWEKDEGFGSSQVDFIRYSTGIGWTVVGTSYQADGYWRGETQSQCSTTIPWDSDYDCDNPQSNAEEGSAQISNPCVG